MGLTPVRVKLAVLSQGNQMKESEFKKAVAFL
jgi:hypothetical protein